MKRAENCVNANISNIYITNDSLVFEFAKSKGHQKGEDHVGPWHVYANPFKPWMCPLLSLARYLCCYPSVLRGNVPLFEGGDCYNTYSKQFSDMLNDLREPLKALGYSPEDLGTHSSRKGVGTHCTSGCTVSPPIVALCLRVGWALGGVKDKYLFRENAGDQVVGRYASLHNPLVKDFAVTQPYFDYSTLNGKVCILRKEEMKSFLTDRIPNASQISPNTWHLMETCFAQICYHYEYLDTTLPLSSPLRAASLFRNIPSELKSLARIAHPWNSTSESPMLTGIPPHVSLLAQMEEMKESMASLESKLLSGLENMMDERGFASHEHNTTTILDALKDQTQKILSDLLVNSKLKLNFGTSDNNVSNNIQNNEPTIIEENVAFDVEDENSFCPLQSAERAKLQRQEMHSRAIAFVGKRTYKAGYHHGSFKVLPPNYQFPSMTSLQLVTNWLTGNIEQNIPPLFTLSCHDLRPIKNGRKLWNKMKAVMSIVEMYARREGCWKRLMDKWTNRSVNFLIETVWDKHIQPNFGAKKRIGNLKWGTLYNKMSKKKAFVSTNRCDEREEIISNDKSGGRDDVSLKRNITKIRQPSPLPSSTTPVTCSTSNVASALAPPVLKPTSCENLYVEPENLQVRPLSPEDNATVHDTLYGDGSSYHHVADLSEAGMGDFVKRSSIRRLLPTMWLNDEVIHFYFSLLILRDRKLCAQDKKGGTVIL